MCGIHFGLGIPLNNVGGLRSPRSSRSLAWFLAFFSQLRGRHATGLALIKGRGYAGNKKEKGADLNVYNSKEFKAIEFTGYTGKINNGVSVVKELGPTENLWKSREGFDVNGGPAITTIPDFIGYDRTKAMYPNLVTGYIGHHRHATVGDSEAVGGAQPFKFSTITGCHNGTLSEGTIKWLRKTLIEDHGMNEKKVNAQTDSWLVFCLADKIGMKKVIPNLYGAWCFVWTDKSKEGIFVLRNGHRPMYVSTDGDLLVGASEGWMVELALEKSGRDVGKGWGDFSKAKMLTPNKLYRFFIEPEKFKIEVEEGEGILSGKAGDYVTARPTQGAVVPVIGSRGYGVDRYGEVFNYEEFMLERETYFDLTGGWCDVCGGAVYFYEREDLMITPDDDCVCPKCSRETPDTNKKGWESFPEWFKIYQGHCLVVDKEKKVG